MRRHVDRAGPQPRWMHESNRLPSRREIAEACPMAETVRSFYPFCGLSGDIVRWQMAGGEVEMARPCALRVCMHRQALYTADKYICRLPASCQPSAGCCAEHRPCMKRALDNKFGACQWHNDKLCRPVAANPCRPCGSRCLPHCGIRFAHHNTHPTLACLFVVCAFLIAFDHTSSRSQPMACKSCTASYHNTSQHIPHYPHSQELFQCRFPFASPSPHSSSSKSHAPLRTCFAWGLFRFAFACAVLFSFCVFLTFFSFSAIFG